MNLDDLQHELHDRADGVSGPAVTGPGVTTSRLAGVRHRVQVARRRRAAAGLVAVVVLAGAATGLPKLPLLHDDTPPAKQVLNDFPGTYNGDPLAERKLGAPGVGTLTLQFTPTDTNLAVVTTCFIDKALATKYGENVDGITTTLKVNGKARNAGCSQGAYTEFVHDGQDAAANRREWGLQGVRKDQPSTIEFIYPGTAPRSVRLAVAVYELDGARLDAGGYRLPVELTFGGEQYGLADSGTTTLTSTALSVSKSVQPGDVVCGVLHAEDPKVNADLDRAQLTVTGAGATAPKTIGSLSDSDLTCSLVRTGGSGTSATGTYAAAAGSQGTVVLAVYRPSAT